jgi:hypothetical protein
MNKRKKTLSENRIDGIIKEYLIEREEFLDNEFEDGLEFSPKTKEALTDMVIGLNEMVADLDIIKEKEGNVLLFTDVYADEYLTDVIKKLNDVIDDINNTTSLESDENIY